MLSSVSLSAVYYVSPSGSDSNPGTSPAQAWQTINKVNSITFAPGDSILFEGGQTFSGGLIFNSGGTPTSPITISSYGTGRATISSGGDNGFYAYNCAGFSITNLFFVGSGAGDPEGDNGIRFFSAGLTGPRLQYIRIDNVDISAYRWAGITFGNDDRDCVGFGDVQITNCAVHGNGDVGITSYGFWPRPDGKYAHGNFYVADSLIYDNAGIPDKGGHSGNGIVFSGMQDTIIEFCTAYNNGYLCNSTGGGPVAIWCWESDNVIFQFNEAHHNSAVYKDGGGFDFDGGASNCIAQYDYSHDNAGAGYLICQFSRSNPYINNIVRYSISANDGLKNGYGAVTFWAGARIQDTLIYNNTFYVTSNCTGAGFSIWSGNITNTQIYNNIILTTAGEEVLNFSKTTGGWYLKNNCYWSSGSPLYINWGGAVYTSLAAFRTATGQETHNGQPVGFETDPLLVNPGGGTADSYRLQASSPMVEHGLNLLTEFGINPGPHDYFNIPLPQGSAYDVGCNEYPGGGGPDTTPPVPNPMTWATVPYATGESSIAMQATTATDLSGVEYYFDCTTTGGHDSAWQDSTTYTDTGLSPNTTYTYTVKARDKSPNHNETAPSTAKSATTNPADTTPPTPNPMTWATLPYSAGTTSIAMVATTASDPSGVEYYFDCTTAGGHDSGWQAGTAYTDTGLTPNTTYTYQVKARDKSINLNETGWSTAESATTDPAGTGDLPWSDGFESGNFTAGGWVTSGLVSVIAQAAYTGLYGANFDAGGSWIEKTLSTSGFADIHVRYARRTKGLDSGEYLYVEWYDGSNWNTLEKLGDTKSKWGTRDQLCGAGANDNSFFKLRFYCLTSNMNEEWAQVDAVEVTGTPIP